MGAALALASQNIADPGKWLDGLERPQNSLLDGRAYPSKAVAPFLEYGDFDPAFLEQVGKRELGLAVTVHDPERSRQIWSALAKNPRAASLLFQLDMPEIAGYTDEKRPLVTGERKTIGEFAKVARAATMGVRKIDSHEADASVDVLLKYYSEHPNFHTYDQLRKVYADLTNERWNDLVYSVSTPADVLTAGADPTRVGVELPPNAWQNFLTDVMRNAPAAAEVLNKERSWANNADENIYEKIMHTKDGASPDRWDRISIAEMNVLFAKSSAAALAQLRQKDEKRASDWVRNVGIALVEVKKNGVDVGGYFQDGVDLVKKNGAAQLQSKLQEYAKSLIKKHFGDSDTTDLGKFLGKGDDYRTRWQAHAESVWNAVVAANSGRLPPVEYDGRSWSGDPSDYEKKYNTKFTFVDKDKKIRLLPVDQIGKGTEGHNYLDGWQQLHAYNEWLKDPAVVRMIAKGSAGNVSDHLDGN